MLNMLEEEHRISQTKKQRKEKARKHQKNLYGHEQNERHGLPAQGTISISDNLLPSPSLPAGSTPLHTNSVDPTSNSSSSSLTTTSSGANNTPRASGTFGQRFGASLIDKIRAQQSNDEIRSQVEQLTKHQEEKFQSNLRD
jgi:hypothetical protein